MAPRRNTIIEILDRSRSDGPLRCWIPARVVTRKRDGFAVAYYFTAQGTKVTVNVPRGEWREI